MLKRSGKSGYHCLGPDFSSSLIAFLMLRDVFYMYFCKGFYYEWILSFIMLFLHLWDSRVAFVLLLMWCITFIDSRYAETSLDPGMNPAWSWLYDLLNVFLDLVCWCLVESLGVSIHQRYWPVIFFFGSIFVFGSGIRVMMAS